MLLELSLAATLALYLLSLGAGLAWIGRAGAPDGDRIATVGPRVFLLAMALFTLPLPIRAMFTLSAEGDVSPQLRQFAAYLPLAVAYCAVFNAVFAASFLRLRRSRAATTPTAPASPVGGLEWATLVAIAGVALWMLFQLAGEAGGLLGLVLMGYKVTETFVGASHYAIGFEWLTGASVVALAIALRSRRRGFLAIVAGLLLAQTAAYAVMGRRGALVVLVGACLYLYHVLWRRLAARFWIAIGLAGFIALNVIGLLRGDKYEDVATLAETVATRGESLREPGEESNLFYTLTTGHFAVPFETLPQVMRTFGDAYAPGIGAYTLRSLLLLVPSGLWEDRPLPLANWYMKEFYEETALNEGRQFFFLSEAYMNFGALGAVIWALLFAWGWFAVAQRSDARRGDPLTVTFVAILVGSTLTFVAADSGFVIAFLKGYAFPVLAVALVRLLRGAGSAAAAVAAR